MRNAVRTPFYFGSAYCRALLRVALAAWALSPLGAGAQSPADPAAQSALPLDGAATESSSPEELTRRLDDLESQLIELRGEFGRLRESLDQPAGEAGDGTREPPIASLIPEPAATEPAEPPEPWNWPIVRLLLVMAIVTAIFFIGQIAFQRWGPDEGDDGPPQPEAMIDLGRVRAAATKEE